jgi:hypothetical protein
MRTLKVSIKPEQDLKAATKNAQISKFPEATSGQRQTLKQAVLLSTKGPHTATGIC